MAAVQFHVRHDFAAATRDVWHELVDWEGHAAWVPSTRMTVDPGDPTAVGATFTAFTGVGPLVLEDRMRVLECAWDDLSSRGGCKVEKLGPVIGGTAAFTVAPTDQGAVVQWFEDVTVPRLPQMVAPVAAWVGAAGFRRAMRKLAKLFEDRDAGLVS